MKKKINKKEVIKKEIKIESKYTAEEMTILNKAKADWDYPGIELFINLEEDTADNLHRYSYKINNQKHNVHIVTLLNEYLEKTLTAKEKKLVDQEMDNTIIKALEDLKEEDEIDKPQWDTSKKPIEEIRAKEIERKQIIESLKKDPAEQKIVGDLR